MADMLSILIVVIAAYFAAKKLIIPRIVAARAAKKGIPATVESSRMEGIPAVQAAIQTGARPVTCFDMRLVSLYTPDDEEDGTDILTQRITYAASEMLLNASLRGDNIRFGIMNGVYNRLVLYVTYTVR